MFGHVLLVTLLILTPMKSSVVPKFFFTIHIEHLKISSLTPKFRIGQLFTNIADKPALTLIILPLIHFQKQ